MEIQEFAKTLSLPEPNKNYSGICAVYLNRISASGKAADIEVMGVKSDRHGNATVPMWFPLSILRVRDDGNFGMTILVPNWFIYKNNLWDYAGR